MRYSQHACSLYSSFTRHLKTFYFNTAFNEWLWLGHLVTARASDSMFLSIDISCYKLFLRLRLRLRLRLHVSRTSNMYPATCVRQQRVQVACPGHKLPGSMLSWCKRGLGPPLSRVWPQYRAISFTSVSALRLLSSRSAAQPADCNNETTSPTTILQTPAARSLWSLLIYCCRCCPLPSARRLTLSSINTIYKKHQIHTLPRHCPYTLCHAHWPFKQTSP